jgi:glycosyltransferase involved in cell wall biosynthesis
VSEEDAGQAAAINKGFRMASGEVYAWLNADDFFLPGAIAAAVETITRTGCGLVHGGWRQVDEHGNTLREVRVIPFDYGRQLEEVNAVCQPGAFFTRDAYRAVGGVDESYRFAMDYELWLKLGSRFPVRHVDRIQAAYRYHDDSKSISEYDAFGPETVRASRRHGGRFFSPLYVNFYLPRWHPRLFRLLLAYRLLKEGKVRELVRGVAGRLGRPETNRR